MIFLVYFGLTNFNIQSSEGGVNHITEFLTEETTPEFLQYLMEHLLDIMVRMQKNQECMSGSRIEGFDLESSDFDIMRIVRSFKVVNPPPDDQILASDHFELIKEYSSPGFVRLRAEVDKESPLERVICYFLFTEQENGFYLSCRKLNRMLEFFNQWETHGPCLSDPDGYFDQALALSSDTWPLEAVGCVHRLLKCGWPSEVVIRDMVRDGCLFVPIGRKTSPYEDIEWRISFSLAEKRLVHSMNHTQFLTYALLKLFLKEVIGTENRIGNLLCSYFMKTLVFWEKMNTNIPWQLSFLLRQFWNCFRRLLCWINNEHCPNFFVPENNMFYNKIYGHNRQTLLQFLSRFYEYGYLMILRIPSIKCEADRWRLITKQTFSIDLMSSIAIEKFLKVNVCLIPFMPSKEVLVFQTPEISQMTIVSEICQYLRISGLNISYNRDLCIRVSNICEHRRKYVEEKGMFLLIKVSSPHCLQSKMFLVIYLYKCKRYENCVRLLKNVLNKINHEEIIYTWAFNVNKFASLGGDVLSVLNGMYSFATISSLPVSLQGRGDKAGSRTILQNQLHCDNGCHIAANTEPICHEIIGDYKNALLSFMKCQECILDRGQTLYFCLMGANKERRRRIDILLENK